MSQNEPLIPTPGPALPLNPVCPYCLADPLMITVRDLKFGNGVTAMIAFCAMPDCRKLFSVSYKEGGNRPRLVLPNLQ